MRVERPDGIRRETRLKAVSVANTNIMALLGLISRRVVRNIKQRLSSSTRTANVEFKGG